MNTTTFQGLVLGIVCVCTAGLGGVAVTQHRQLESLHSARTSSDVLEQQDERWSKVERAQVKLQAALGPIQREQQQQADALEGLQQRTEQTATALQSLVDAPPPEPISEDLAPIENRLQMLEQRADAQDARLKQTSKPPRAAKPAKVVSKIQPSAKPVPPFEVLGLESRGAERFLAVLPSGEPALRYVRLLQPGETFGGWTLRVASTGTATFAIPGSPDQTLAIPVGTPP